MDSSSSFSKTSVNFIFHSYSSSSSKEFSKFKRKYTTTKTDFQVHMHLTKVTIDRGGWLDLDVMEASDDMYSTGVSTISDVFAAYPAAFIIAKDIIIRYIFNADDVEQQGARYAHEASESGGGFFCFSHSSGQSSAKH